VLGIKEVKSVEILVEFRYCGEFILDAQVHVFVDGVEGAIFGLRVRRTKVKHVIFSNEIVEGYCTPTVIKLSPGEMLHNFRAYRFALMNRSYMGASQLRIKKNGLRTNGSSNSLVRRSVVTKLDVQPLVTKSSRSSTRENVTD